MPTTQSLSKPRTPAAVGCGIAMMTVFGLVFGAVGFGVAFGTTGRSLMNQRSAQSWQPAQCEITFSEVTGSGSRDTSRVNIQYRYTWNGRPYTGKRYDFTTGSDNINNAAKEAIVAAHPPGQTVACFVDPADPTQSVINRDWKWGYLLGLAFGTPFAIVPVVIFGAMLYARRKSKQIQAKAMAIPGAATLPDMASAGAPAQAFVGTSASGSGFASATTFGSPSMGASTTTPIAGGPVVLKPESSRIGRVIGMILLCLFWNGIVGIFTYFEFTGQGPGASGWFLYLFLIPFQLIGAGLLWGVVSSVLALANPKPTLTLSNAWVPVGGSMTLQWKMSGATGRLRNLSIVLRGREEARYRRGTNHYTDKHTFHETQVVETTESMRIASGMATISIPANTMHSFAAADNKIIWSLQVTGEIAFWPDVDETFDLLVRPR